MTAFVESKRRENLLGQIENEGNLYGEIFFDSHKLTIAQILFGMTVFC